MWGGPDTKDQGFFRRMKNATQLEAVCFDIFEMKHFDLVGLKCFLIKKFFQINFDKYSLEKRNVKYLEMNSYEFLCPKNLRVFFFPQSKLEAGCCSPQILK